MNFLLSHICICYTTPVRDITYYNHRARGRDDYKLCYILNGGGITNLFSVLSMRTGYSMLHCCYCVVAG